MGWKEGGSMLVPEIKALTHVSPFDGVRLLDGAKGFRSEMNLGCLVNRFQGEAKVFASHS